MKKLSTLLSVLFLGSVLSLAACKKKEEKTDDKAAKPTEEVKPEEKKPEEPKPDEAKPAEGAAAGTGLAECDAYAAAMEKYLACDKLPEAARPGAQQGLDAMKASWGDTANMPEEAKTAANDACKKAVDALKQSASTMGCTL